MERTIYTAKFGEQSIRFVLLKSELYVSRTDIVEAIRACATDVIKPAIESIVDKWLTMAGDIHDRKGAIIGKSSIGSVIHFHAVGNLLDVLSSFNDVSDNDLRETGYRVRSLFIWFSGASNSANDHFGISIFDMLNSVKNRLDRIDPPFIVTVIHDDMWVAECDELGLVTEAKSYDELTERVWGVAPELYELNGFDGDPDNMRISFVQEQSHSRVAL